MRKETHLGPLFSIGEPSRSSQQLVWVSSGRMDVQTEEFWNWEAAKCLFLQRVGPTILGWCHVTALNCAS